MAPIHKRTLVLVRHAHRDKSQGRSKDNGLSKKGWEQAEKVREYFLKRFGTDTPCELLSSAKKRCLETLEPISGKLKKEIIEDSLLMEAQGDDVGESLESFMRRVRQFTQQWKKGKGPLVVACSHGDWIPEALFILCGTRTELKKGGWAEIELEKGEAKLVRLLQEL